MTNRRGACPSLYAPMSSGDGWLVRMTIRSTLSLEAFEQLCGAARHHGNGVMQITARGNLQVRGLTPRSADAFAADALALGVDPPGLPITIPPLAGLEQAETADVTPLAEALARQARATALGPKVCVVLDGTGGLHLDTVGADVRLNWGDACWHVALAGDAARAVGLGAIAPGVALEAAMRLLDVIAARGPDARARSVIAAEGVAPFRHALHDLLFAGPALPRRAPREPLGLHILRAGKAAQGLGLPFGYAHGSDLKALIIEARRAGATGLRLAPGRALLLLLDSPEAAEAVCAAACRLGLMVRADDPRRAIAACPGTPACASGEIAARDLATRIAAAAAPLLDGSASLHVSGCRKGCAHPEPATLTIVGRDGGCGLLFDGAAGDPPAAVVAPAALTALLAELADQLGPRQTAAELLGAAAPRLLAAIDATRP